jgi:hypothetical protein
MLRIFSKTTLLAAALLTGICIGLFAASPVAAQGPDDCPPTCHQCSHGSGLSCLHHPRVNCRDRQYGQPDLFYNYYVPDTCGGVPAAMYIAPRPVPPLVGHTYYTYQPFLPHELLYQHHRTYYRYYNHGRGLTRTHISWKRAPMTGATQFLRIAR